MALRCGGLRHVSWQRPSFGRSGECAPAATRACRAALLCVRTRLSAERGELRWGCHGKPLLRAICGVQTTVDDYRAISRAGYLPPGDHHWHVRPASCETPLWRLGWGVYSHIGPEAPGLWVASCLRQPRCCLLQRCLSPSPRRGSRAGPDSDAGPGAHLGCDSVLLARC